MKTLIMLTLALLVMPFATAKPSEKPAGNGHTPTQEEFVQIPKAERPSFMDNLTYRINNTIASHYWGDIVGGIFYTGGPVNFTDLTITDVDDVGSFYLLLGMINPLDTLKYDYHGGTEYYFGLGRSFDLWKNEEGKPLVALDIFAMYDALSDVGRFNDDVIQQRLSIAFPQTPFVTPYVEFYNWEKSGNKSPSVGWFARAGAKHSFPLGLEVRGHELALDADLSIGYSGEGLFGTSEGLAYYRAVIGTKVQLSQHLSIAPSVIIQTPGNQEEGGHAFVEYNGRLFYNLRLSWEF